MNRESEADGVGDIAIQLFPDIIRSEEHETRLDLDLDQAVVIQSILPIDMDLDTQVLLAQGPKLFFRHGLGPADQGDSDEESHHLGLVVADQELVHVACDDRVSQVDPEIVIAVAEEKLGYRAHVSWLSCCWCGVLSRPATVNGNDFRSWYVPSIMQAESQAVWYDTRKGPDVECHTDTHPHTP